MPKRSATVHASFASRYLPGAVILVALGILGGTIFFATYDLRRKNREQLITAPVQILHALFQNQEVSDQTEGDGTDQNLRASDQLPTLLETAQKIQLPQMAHLLKTLVLGTRLFEPNGHCVYADATVSESTVAPEDLASLRSLQPLAHFYPAADLGAVLLNASDTGAKVGPLLEIYIPLHRQQGQQLLGIAQFLLDGTTMAAEFKTLDRNLIVRSTLEFLVGGGLLVLVLQGAFRQLERLNQLLRERTQSLLAANQDLALAAKTSAVGAVTAHLIHGLKNPLSGLQTFVASRGLDPEAGTESDWQMALSSTRRMQSIISEIVRVLQDEQGDTAYQLSLEEFADMLQKKINPLARGAGIQFQLQAEIESALSNREANLISLVLYNLVQNAIQATPAGKSVSVQIKANGSKLVFIVRDEGKGIPELQRRNLFKPCQSTKEGGSGVGLAISKQLANSIGAELELAETGPSGTTFTLAFAPQQGVVPSELAADNTTT